jgi:pimeloyl-ACP methyl ester carboxylesterase
MAGFTLIHGSTQSKAWERVEAGLRERGHEVVSPELPRREPSWGLRQYASLIADLASTSRPRIIAAHSFSGVFLPLLGDSTDMLVFVAALIPAPGRSVRDQFTADPSMLLPDWVAAGSRWFDPREHEAMARQFLFHDCDEETLPWALSTVELFDTRHLITEPSPIDEWPDVRCASIICTGDRTVNPEWSRRAARSIGAEAIEMDAGHCPQTSRPVELAMILDRLAAEPG